MRLLQVYEIFMTDRKVSGFTQKTLDYYHDSAGGWVRFILSKDPEVKLSGLSQWVKTYLLELQERGTSPNTRQTYLRGIKTFVRFLHHEGYIETPVDIPKLKVPQVIIRPLSIQQMRMVLHSFDEKTFTGLRNQTLLRLLFDSGLRLMEVSDIELDDLNLEEGFVLIRGKGQKERWVPFGKETSKALWRYFKQRERFVRDGNPALFIKRDGDRLDARGVQMVFKRLRKKINLKGVRLSPHTARHSFALAYIENGGDPFSLQRILGHTTQTMTSRYINMAKRSVKAQHEKFSIGNVL